jgi:glycosyltransferase involved in cell wall biosynthesis
VAIEAMACGLPVAAFDRGAAREVVGEAGRFAPPNDWETLAGAIADALTIPRIVPRNRVERLFTRDRWLDSCEHLYREVGSATASAA